jgi:hypothetical protein
MYYVQTITTVQGMEVEVDFKSSIVTMSLQRALRKALTRLVVLINLHQMMPVGFATTELLSRSNVLSSC